MIWMLILLLTIVPIVELALLIELGRATSTFFTIGVIILTGVVGAILARMQGLAVWRRIRAEMSRGQLPGDSLLDGAMILVAAALLVTPGLLTDATGFLLLAPPTRAVFRRVLKAWVKRRIAVTMQGGAGSVEYRPIHDEPPPGAPPMEDDPREK